MDEEMDDIIGEAHKPLEFRIPFKGGKPKPTAELLKDGVPVDDVDIEVLDDEVTFFFRFRFSPGHHIR